MIRRRVLLLGAAGLSTVSLTGCFQTLQAVGSAAQMASSLSTVANGGKPVTAQTLLEGQTALKKEIKNFLSSLSKSQVNLSQALGLKAQAAELKKSAGAFVRGVVDGTTLEKQTTVSAQANAAIEAAMKKAESFTEAQKKKVSESLAKYADACVSTLKVAGIASNSALQTTSLITSGQITDIDDLKEKMSLTADAASNLPGFGADLVKMGWSYIDLAKEKGVDTSVAAETLKNAI